MHNRSFSKAAWLITLAACFLLSSLASAQTGVVRGFIRAASKNGVLLDVEAAVAPYAIEPACATVVADLRQLKVGDYVVARGRLDRGRLVAHLESIESVGLSELIGSWQTDSGQIFEFEDFTRLNLYRTFRSGAIVTLSKMQQYDYVITPDTGSTYSIFLSDNRAVHIGSISFSHLRVELTMLDPETGRVAENISLSPLAVK